MLWNSYSDRKTVGSDYVVLSFFTFSSTFSAAKRWLENSSPPCAIELGFFTRYHRLCLVTEKSFIFLFTLKLNIIFDFFFINHTGIKHEEPIFVSYLNFNNQTFTFIFICGN